MKVACQFCDDEHVRHMVKLFPENYTDSSIYDTLYNILPEYEDMLYLCKFMDRTASCNNYLYPYLTEYGVCFSFNTLRADDIYTNELVSSDLYVYSIILF